MNCLVSVALPKRNGLDARFSEGRKALWTVVMQSLCRTRFINKVLLRFLRILVVGEFTLCFTLCLFTRPDNVSIFLCSVLRYVSFLPKRFNRDIL